jgi:cytochrome c oxidase subunit 2
MDFIRNFIESYLPENFSAHGSEVDNLIVWVHYLMFILFVGWGFYFIYTLYRFRSSNNPKASYKGITNHYSTYVEAGIILFEVFLLFSLALPGWKRLKTNVEKPQIIEIQNSVYETRDNLISDFDIEDDITTYFPESEVNQNMQVIHVIAQTFNYNIHYPGPDGKFGPRHRYLVDDGEGEFIGLDWNHPDSKDDIVLLDELILEVDKPVLIYLTSKDVIHSFFLPEFRVKQDAIPGQRVAIFFTPEKTTKDFLEGLNPSAEDFSLWDWIADPENYDYDYLDYNNDGTSMNFSGERGIKIAETYGRDTFQLGCAQLCGSGHAKMNKGDMFIVSKEDYQKWYFSQMWAKNSVVVDEDEDEDW